MTALELITQSIQKCNESIQLQEQARILLQENGGSEVEGNYVRVDENLPQAILDAQEGDILIVSPYLVTSIDTLIINKPLQIIGASIHGFVDVQEYNVALIGCSITGHRPEGALLSTGDNLLVSGCRLTGSSQGQHRGVWVRSADVHIMDTSITNIWKQGQEAQSIAGWDHVAHLTVERCWLEAAGENFILGGTDSTSEESMPHDVVVRDCRMTKPLQWREMGFVVKNLFELKAVKNFLMEGCTLDYSWVEGQTGFAIVINVRNQEGNAPWSTIEDVIIRKNFIYHMAGGIQFLGTDYTHPSGLMKRVLIEDNVFWDISPSWGNNQRCLQFSHGGEDIALVRNEMTGNEINSFMTFEGQPLVRLVVDSNIFPEGYYGIKADDTSLGLPTLEKYAPDCTWTANTVVRTVEGNNIQYPPDTTIA